MPSDGKTIQDRGGAPHGRPALGLPVSQSLCERTRGEGISLCTPAASVTPLGASQTPPVLQHHAWCFKLDAHRAQIWKQGLLKGLSVGQDHAALFQALLLSLLHA